MVFLKSLKFFIMLNTSFCFIPKKSFFHVQESIFFFYFKHSYICNLTKQWIKSNNPKLLAYLSYGSLSQCKTLDYPNPESEFQPLQRPVATMGSVLKLLFLPPELYNGDRSHHLFVLVTQVASLLLLSPSSLPQWEPSGAL